MTVIWKTRLAGTGYRKLGYGKKRVVMENAGSHGNAGSHEKLGYMRLFFGKQIYDYEHNNIVSINCFHRRSGQGGAQDPLKISQSAN